MIKKIKRTTLISIAVVLLFLIITNPSMKRFKEFNNSEVQRRVSNYIIFSIYKTGDDIYNVDDHYIMGRQNEKYVGIAFNFYQIDY
jgi:hypothetical protein